MFHFENRGDGGGSAEFSGGDILNEYVEVESGGGLNSPS
jgi:hypothetical protein